MSYDPEQQRAQEVDLDIAGEEHDDLAEEEEAAMDRDAARATSNAALRRDARDAGVGDHAHADRDAHGRKSNTPKVRSARFEGDAWIDEAKAGKRDFEAGDYGAHILKVQQALIDLGYKLPDGATGVFDKATKKAVKKFQRKVGLRPTGKVDDDTMAAIQKKFDSRKPYVKAGKYDEHNPGTHELSESERRQALEAMVPITGASSGSSDAFIDVVNGEMYGDRMKAQLKFAIADSQKYLYEDRKDERSDPDDNLHEWSTLEGPAKAAKQATDKVYGSYAKDKAATEISVRAGTLVDNWEDQTARMNAQTPDENREWAKEKIWYFIYSDDGCAEINRQHHANPDAPAEKAILTPIVELLTNTPDKVKTVLETEIGWGAMQGDGMVKIQRFKEDTKEGNRAQLWDLFHTCIHEYLHLVAHDGLWDYVDRLESAGDAVRAHTLREGFCDFFTLNVRASLDIDKKLQKAVEGPYYAKHKKPPPIDPGLYSAHGEAERVVGVVGIRNAESAYFLGETKLIGDA